MASKSPLWSTVQTTKFKFWRDLLWIQMWMLHYFVSVIVSHMYLRHSALTWPKQSNGWISTMKIMCWKKYEIASSSANNKKNYHSKAQDITANGERLENNTKFCSTTMLHHTSLAYLGGL